MIEYALPAVVTIYALTERTQIMSWLWGKADDVQAGDEVVRRGSDGKAERVRHRGDPDELVYGKRAVVFRDDAGRKVYVDPDEHQGHRQR